MHILVHVIRHVIVDDMGHVGDVHPSGGHGSCHQDWLVAGAEVEQGFLPFSLKPDDNLFTIERVAKRIHVPKFSC